MSIQMINTRSSDSYIGTFKIGDTKDETALTEVKNMVRHINKSLRQSHAKDRFGSEIQYRVCVKGRRPVHKELNPRTGNLVSYSKFGDIVGGIRNATFVDAYIYRRVR